MKTIQLEVKDDYLENILNFLKLLPENVVKIKELSNLDKKDDVNSDKISDDPNHPIEFEDNILAWIDKDTGLMWEVKNRENIKYHYVWSKEWIEKVSYPEGLNDDVKDAFSYAKKLNRMNYGGFSDWRVPTKDELRTILTKEVSKTRGLNDRFYYTKEPLSQNTQRQWYWLSSPHCDDVSIAWRIGFYYGYNSWNGKTNRGYVRCVRNLSDEEK